MDNDEMKSSDELSDVMSEIDEKEDEKMRIELTFRVI